MIHLMRIYYLPETRQVVEAYDATGAITKMRAWKYTAQDLIVIGSYPLG